jgi:hypothetical protein
MYGKVGMILFSSTKPMVERRFLYLLLNPQKLPTVLRKLYQRLPPDKRQQPARELVIS